jgi:hypothetical protein
MPGNVSFVLINVGSDVARWKGYSMRRKKTTNSEEKDDKRE